MSSTGQAPVVGLAAPTDADIPLIARWLQSDHVRRYWGDPEENLSLIRDPSSSSHRALVLADGRKVGLILWQHPSREELDEAGLNEIPTSVIDIDIMIGDESAAGRGIGSAAIRLVAEQALADSAVPYVIAATSTSNTGSRKALAKAGFEEAREFDDPIWGRCVLMVLQRSGTVLPEGAMS